MVCPNTGGNESREGMKLEKLKRKLLYCQRKMRCPKTQNVIFHDFDFRRCECFAHLIKSLLTVYRLRRGHQKSYRW